MQNDIVKNFDATPNFGAHNQGASNATFGWRIWYHLAKLHVCEIRKAFEYLEVIRYIEYINQLPCVEEKKSCGFGSCGLSLVLPWIVLSKSLVTIKLASHYVLLSRQHPWTSIHRYASLYRTLLCRNTRYTARFSGSGTRLLDWTVRLFSFSPGLQFTIHWTLCRTPDHSGITRHICTHHPLLCVWAGRRQWIALHLQRICWWRGRSLHTGTSASFCKIK